MLKIDKRQKRAKKLATQKKKSLTKKHLLNRDSNNRRTSNGMELPNPYVNDSNLQADLELALESVKEYFGDVPDNFKPPLLSEESTEDCISLHPWNKVFRDKMIDRYDSLENADPYLRYSIFRFMEERI